MLVLYRTCLLIEVNELLYLACWRDAPPKRKISRSTQEINQFLITLKKSKSYWWINEITVEHKPLFFWIASLNFNWKFTLFLLLKIQIKIDHRAFKSEQIVLMWMPWKSCASQFHFFEWRFMCWRDVDTIIQFFNFSHKYFTQNSTNSTVQIFPEDIWGFIHG